MLRLYGREEWGMGNGEFGVGTGLIESSVIDGELIGVANLVNFLVPGLAF